MHEQPRNRDWVKNAAIIFLVVLLVLTFFSNTIMNRSLPEVATQEVESGSIVARVRGTGTVQANSNTQVKMDRTRVIRSVLVKVGQKVEAGDVLFTLGEGASEEIDAAEETLRNLQASYNRTAATIPEYNYSTDTRKIGILAEKLAEAQSAWEKANDKKNASLNEESLENLKIIQSELARATEARKEAERKYNDDIAKLEELQGWKNKQDSILPEMVEHELLDGDLISSSSGYSDRARIEVQISRVETEESATTYSVIFYNDDGTALQSSNLSPNAVPAYNYGTPTSSKDTATETYQFLKWVDPDGNPIAPVTKDTTYTATYSETPVSTATYTIIFYNDDGAALESSNLSYNSVPKYSYGTPTSSKDTATETYQFLKWVDTDGNPIAPVTKDTSYTATYSDTPTTTATYSIVFYNDDGTALESSTVSPNTVPRYSYGTPTSSKDTATETYQFLKWVDPDGNPIAPATKDTSYSATYSDTPVTKTSDIIINTGSIIINEGEKTDNNPDGALGLGAVNGSSVTDDLDVSDDLDQLYSQNVEELELALDESKKNTDELYEAKAQEETSPQTDAYVFDLDTQYPDLARLYNLHATWEEKPLDWLDCLKYCLKVYNECENKIFVLQTSSVEEYEKALEEEIKWSDLYNKYMESITPEGVNAKARYDAYRTAKDNYDTAVEAYHDKKANNETTLAGYNADLANLWQQIQRAQKKLDDLLGGEEATITARVAGTIQTLDASPGDTKKKDDVIATIEAPDMGYTMSFSVTNDQANRLRVGDTGTVSNFYWGSEITATLRSIQIDQKNPQTNKLLTFDLSGNVTSGTELTVSVGQKSASYDVIIPSSSVRTDANGTYVLKLESKNSPLGNRYLARRVPVEVLAVDDTNSAVSADLGYGDYVITSSSSPLKNGQLVRLATSG